MIKLFTIFITCMVLIAANAFADNAIDAAAQRLQIDVAKMQTDIAADADKNVLLADKRKIKLDKTDLKAARQAAKLELIKGHESN